MTIRSCSALLAVTILLAACETAAPAAIRGPRSPSPSPSEPAPVRVAFIKDLSVPDADEHALPASNAVGLALATAEITDAVAVDVELEEFDLADGADGLPEIADDPAYVAAIVAPGVDLRTIQLPEELPVISLSGIRDPSAPGAFLRLVPRIRTVAHVLARALRRSHPCVVSEDPSPDPLWHLLAEQLPRSASATIAPSDAAAFAGHAGCTIVVWAGGPDAAAEAASVLSPADVTFAGGDRLLDPDFVASAGPAAEGAFAACPCADVSTSTDLAARRFIQDYQSEHGAPPGAYAVEGWDAAWLVIGALRGSAPTREQVALLLDGIGNAAGLASDYRFDPDGELLRPRTHVRSYRVEGGRWFARPNGLRCVATEACRMMG